MPHSNFVTASPIRAARRRLGRGTAAAAVAAVMLLAPGAALAADACGAPALGAVHCPLTAAPYPGIQYHVPAGAPPQDLTLVIEPGAEVETSGDYEPAILATNWTGGLTIEAGGTNVSTQGTGALGIAGVTDAGDLTIVAGQVATEGSEAHAIVGRSVSGAISISADTVATRGDAAHGIDVEGLSGPISIKADTISTAGTYAHGVRAVSAEGGLAIDVESVSTSGDFSNGINAQAGIRPPADEVEQDEIAFGPDTAIAIKAGEVATSGGSADGISAINFTHGQTNVEAGTVTTTGANSWGIYAGGFGDVTIKAGSVVTDGADSVGIGATTIEGNLVIEAGDVSTRGDWATGINAIGYNANGTISVTAGSIKTEGDHAAGIAIFSPNLEAGPDRAVHLAVDKVQTDGVQSIGIAVDVPYGDITATIGSVNVLGFQSRGVQLGTVGGDINATIGEVHTYGDVAAGRDSTAITLINSVGNINADIGSVSTKGDFSTGIATNLYGGAQTITVHGNVTTAGDFSQGALLSGSYSTLDAKFEGLVSTSGLNGHGLTIYMTNADANVAANAVDTSGDGATGIFLSSVNFADGTHVAAIDAGSVTTRGNGAHAIEIQALGADAAVKAGTVTTSGDGSSGIKALAFKGYDYDGGTFGGTIDIQVGKVTTTGYGAHGIDTASTGDTTIVVGSAETFGERADAVHAIGYGNGNVTVEAGDISTHGYRSNGIKVTSIPFSYEDAGNITIEAGSVRTEGTAAMGISAAANFGQIDIKAGSVTTSGEGGDAVYAYAGHGNIAIDVGDIATTGNSGRGVIAYSGGTTNVKVGNLTTSGQGFDPSSDAGGIIAVGTAVNVEAGSVRTSGDFSSGIVATSNFTNSLLQDDHDIRITAGTVATEGYASHGILAVNLFGNTHISADSVTTKGDRSAGIYSYAVFGNTTIEAGSVATSGEGSTAIGAVALYGGSIAISAGDVTTEGHGARGIEAISGPGFDPSVRGDVTIVTSGPVRTSGDLSDAIFGYSATGNVDISAGGDVRTFGFGSYGIAGISLSGDVGIQAGDVSTFGHYGVGIFGQAGGDLTIEAGTVQTSGAYSPAIAALAGGNVSVKADAVETRGFFSQGILVEAGGSAKVDIGDAFTAGHFANAIEVRGASADVTVRGTISTEGDYSRGARALAYGGTAAIHSSGSVSTRGVSATGLYALGRDGVTIDGGGNVATLGDRASAVVGASSAGGPVTITQGSVSTRGNNATGIYAGIRDFYYTGAAGDIQIKAESAATHGAQSRAVMAVNLGGGDIAIDIAKDVSTRKNDAHAIYAFAPTGTVQVHVGGTVSTRGPDSHGVLAIGSNVDIALGGVTTSGDDSVGIYGYALNGGVKIKAGDITTEGDVAEGIIGIATGGISIDVANVKTGGSEATGIFALNGLFGAPSDISIKAGSVTISGQYALGINAINLAGGVTIDAGAVSTRGDYGIGIASGAAGSPNIIRASSIRTEGDKAIGVYALNSQGGTVSITTGTVDTSGDFSAGIRTFSEAGKVSVDAKSVVTRGRQSQGIFVHSLYGDVDLKSSGVIETQGTYSEAVRVNAFDSHSVIDVASVKTAGDGSTGVHFFGVGDSGKSASVKVGTLTTSGAGAHGVWLENPAGGVIITRNGKRGTTGLMAVGDGLRDLSLEANSIQVTGAGSHGVYANGTGRITLDLRDVRSAKAAAIKTISREETALTVRGTIASGAAAAADMAGSDVSVTIGKDGKVVGATGLLINATGPASEGGPGLPGIPGGEGPFATGAVPMTAAAAPGKVRVDNAGTIAGTGFAIIADSGQTSIVNSGTISGSIRTQFYDDSFTNSGTWSFSASSDFGDGFDSLVNSGFVELAAGSAARGPATVTLAGLDRLENRGVLSLQNNVAGDRLTLPGDYVAGSGAKLALDIGSGGIADRLTIGGTVSGTTAVYLANLDPKKAQLFAGPVTLIETRAGTSANAFTLEGGSAGFVQYGLSFDAATASFRVTSQAGAPVYRFAKMTEGVQSLWLKSADSWSSHMANLRYGGGDGKRLWGQMFGGADTRDETRTITNPGSNPIAIELGYRQDYVGAELGYDFVRGDKLTVGAMAGYLGSKQKFRGSADRAKYDAINLGGYAGVRSGPFHANLLLKYDSISATATIADLDTVAKIDGSAFGAQLEAGARFGSDGFFIEPAASLSWQSARLDDLTALGQLIRFDDFTGLRGKIGGRVGGTTTLGKARLVYYAGGNFVHEFDGEAAATLESGGTSATIDGKRIGDHGQALLGLAIGSPDGAVSGYVEGSANFGGSYKGGGGRVGIRVKF